MRLCFYAGLLAFAMTATQAIQLDTDENFLEFMETHKVKSKEKSVDEAIKKMLAPTKEEKQGEKMKKEMDAGKVP